MANETEIEKLTVTLEADYQDFLKQIDRAVQEAARKLRDEEEAAKKAAKESKTAFQQFEEFLSGKLVKTITSVGAALVAAFAVQNIINFFGAIGKASVDANAQFETFIVQFQTLLGSAEAAQERIKELAEFGQTTPFELPEIVEANRLLQTFGGSLLATDENMRRIGDSAAAVNANFQEVSFWVGRLYSAIQAGRPFGESAARLQELGILSGEARTKLEDLQKAGASGAEIWEAYLKATEGFTGAMDKLSKTFQGVMSNLADFQGMLLREGGAEFFEGLREDATEFYDIINDPVAKEALTGLAEAIGHIANALRDMVTTPLLEQLEDLDPREVGELSASIKDIGDALGNISGLQLGSLEGVINSLTGLSQTVASLIELADAIKEISLNVGGLKLLEHAGVDLGETFLSIANPIYGLGTAFDALNTRVEELTGSSISEWLGNTADSFDDVRFASEGSIGGIEGAGEAAVEAAEDFSKAKERLDDLASSFDDLQEQTGEKRAELEKEHGEKIADIDADLAEKQVEIAEDLADKQAEAAKERNEALTDLEEELADRRQEIAESTKEALAELEEDIADRRKEIIEKTSEDLAKAYTDTNEAIAEAQEEAHKKEARETEDHQRDMKAMQDQYLFDLQDAVTARDARAIVDLRRRFQKEKQEKERDLKADQSRSREDLDDRVSELRANLGKRQQEILKNEKKELQQLRENEAERRGEILESQAEQLADLAEHEAEKRAQIEETYQEQLAKAQEAHDEQMAKAQEHHAEAMARENERYDERKQALDEALQKRLEDVAKELADEKDITEEGAKAILEQLNKTFGVGGDIDALMESFQARRRLKMTIQIGFERSVSDEEETERPGSRPGQQNQQRTRPASRPGLQNRPRFQEGGLVPGPIGSPMDAIVHGGEWIIPHEDVMQMVGVRQGNAGSREMRVKLDISGSAPPGIRGGEVDQIAGVLVKALNEAGVKARR